MPPVVDSLVDPDNKRKVMEDAKSQIATPQAQYRGLQSTPRVHQSTFDAKLEAPARVDLPHLCNDIRRSPQSAASPLAVQLAQLQAITKVPPLCTEHYHNKRYTARNSFARNDNSLETLPQSVQHSRKETEGAAAKQGRTGWAAGTGYGRGDEENEVWNVAAAEAAQRALDREMEQLMTGITQLLRMEISTPHTPVTIPTAPVPKSPRAALGAREAAGQRQQRPEASAMTLDDPGTGLGPGTVNIVCDSCLAPFLVQELVKASFTEMTARVPYYTTLLQVTLQVCRPELLNLFTSAPSGCTLAEAVMQLQPAATRFLQAMEQKQLPQATASANIPVSASAIHDSQQERDSTQLSHLLLRLCTTLEQCARQAKQASSRATLTVEPSGDYCTQMRPFKLEHLSEFLSPHAFLRNTQMEGMQPRERVLRLAREAAGLSNLLPLSESSSILVRVLDSNISLWQALITGPENTPYAGGCFLFDFYFPPQYPKVPPQVLFKTTGGGTIRFNPNLYNCGKICLSLLGTWGAQQGEGWIADVSSALQVLVSIQSLILVPDPYFNEPGYERNIGTGQGTAASRAYNKVIQLGTLGRAMVDYLQRPPTEFADAIQTHFRLRGDWILANAQRWIDEANITHDTAHAAALSGLRSQLVPLIAALKRAPGAPAAVAQPAGAIQTSGGGLVGRRLWG